MVIVGCLCGYFWMFVWLFLNVCVVGFAFCVVVFVSLCILFL